MLQFKQYLSRLKFIGSYIMLIFIKNKKTLANLAVCKLNIRVWQIICQKTNLDLYFIKIKVYILNCFLSTNYRFLYLLKYRALYFYLSLLLKPLTFFIFNISISIIIRLTFLNPIVVAEEYPIIKDIIYQDPLTEDIYQEILSKSGQVYVSSGPVTFTSQEEFDELDSTKFQPLKSPQLKSVPITYSPSTTNFFTNWLSNWWQHRWVDWYNQLFPKHLSSSDSSSAESNPDTSTFIPTEAEVVNIPLLSRELFEKFCCIAEFGSEDAEDETEQILLHLRFVSNYLPKNFWATTTEECVNEYSPVNLLLHELFRLPAAQSDTQLALIFYLNAAICTLNTAGAIQKNLEDYPELLVEIYQAAIKKMLDS